MGHARIFPVWLACSCLVAGASGGAVAPTSAQLGESWLTGARGAFAAQHAQPAPPVRAAAPDIDVVLAAQRPPVDLDRAPRSPVPSDAMAPRPPSAEPPPAPCDIAVEDLSLVDPSAVAQVYFSPTDEQVVSLTFDDGPSGAHTPNILRILKRYDVEATFFVLGERVEKNPDLAAAIAAAGHELGNHTWSHPSMRTLWKSQIRDEVCRTNAAVEAATGLVPALFRPPFGRFAPSAVPLLGALGMHIILWSSDGTDWDTDDPQVVASRIVREAKPGGVVLLHDSNPVTALALPLVIEGLHDRGYAIRPVGAATGLTPYWNARAGRVRGDSLDR